MDSEQLGVLDSIMRYPLIELTDSPLADLV